MAKFKVLKRFKGIKEDKVFSKGQEIELTNARAKEINEKLKGCLEEVKEEVKEETKKEPKKEKK